MIRGLITNGIAPSQLSACDLSKAAVDSLPNGVRGFIQDARGLVEASDIIVIAVKPNGVVPILTEISYALQAELDKKVARPWSLIYIFLFFHLFFA